jgi:hypothetical protein
MGASRPYTIFAGLGEVLGAVLLIWRPTATFGAWVSIAVMTNIVMLNYCYDVPVKLYSTHLLLMAVLIVVPDLRRMWNVFVQNRATEPFAPVTIWDDRVIWWFGLVAKLVVITVLFALPLWHRSVEIYEHLSTPPEASAVDDPAGPLVKRRGFRWINEVPFNR